MQKLARMLWLVSLAVCSVQGQPAEVRGKKLLGFVRIYSETPRWWSAEGKPVKLPEAYEAALRKALQR